jgi:hypothetical protein
LALVAAWLRVLLDHDRAPVGHLANHGQRVARVVDLVRARSVARRDVVAGAEAARADGLAGFYQLRGREHVLAVHRRIERRRDAVREVDRLLEIAPRPHTAPFAVVVRVHVDEAGDDRLA